MKWWIGFAALLAAFHSAGAFAQQAGAACPEADKVASYQHFVPTLGVAYDGTLFPSDQPITLHLTYAAGSPDVGDTPDIRAGGTLKPWFGEGTAEAIALTVLSWKPTTNDKKAGDIVIAPVPTQKLYALDVPRLDVVIALCTGSAGSKVVQASAKMTGLISPRGASIAAALVLTVLLYVLGALSISTARGWSRLNPLWLSVDGTGRASLSNMQIIFFSVIVLYLVIYILLRTGILANLSTDVLLLLGITGVGSTAGKLATTNTRRISFENWAWAKQKGWTAPSGNHVKAPQWSDLFTTDGDFDPYRFQMLSFSFVVGVALLMIGLSGLAGFAIPPGLLGVIGLSQATYVGGKIVTSGTVGELDDKLTALRKAEQDFLTATAKAWLPPTPVTGSLASAVEMDPTEYMKFKALVGPAWTMFQELFVERGTNPRFEPGT